MTFIRGADDGDGGLGVATGVDRASSGDRDEGGNQKLK